MRTFRRMGARMRAWRVAHQAERRRVAPSLLAVLLAVPLMLACGVRFTTLSHVAARDLTLQVSVFGKDVSDPTVIVQVRYLVAGYAGVPYISSAHTLTCNGVPIPLTTRINAATVPRQPPGGAYTLVYTDDQHQRTTLTVPVPRGAFAITAPAEGAHIKIPQPPAASGAGFTTGGSSAPILTTSLAALDPTPAPPTTPTAPPMNATPTPPATLSPSASPTAGGTPTRGPDRVGQPPIIFRYTVPTIPTSATANLELTARCGQVGGLQCGMISGFARQMTGTFALTDSSVAPGYGFESFVPGPGELDAKLTAGWALPSSGFKQARVDYSDQVAIHVTWTR